MAKIKQKFDFLDSFDKEIEKMEGVSTEGSPPRYWHSFGNHTINRVMSGSFYKGIPQGRITALCGPSHAGKSFLAGNLCRQAQEDGAYVLVIDSENALDNEFMQRIGVDTRPEAGYKYTSPTTIPQTVKIVSNFINKYKAEVGMSVDAPPVLIVVDSLDGCQTPAEYEAAAKGEIQFDRGQKPKMQKSMLMGWIPDIKSLNISIVVTKQVYRASQEQILQGEGSWVVNDAIRFPCSQILLATKLKLKDKTTKAVTGIKMKVESFKSRFTLNNVSVIEVPWDAPMSPYSGCFDIALTLGVIKQSGAWYTIPGDEKKYRRDDIESNKMEEIIKLCEQAGGGSVDSFALISDEYDEVTGVKPANWSEE